MEENNIKDLTRFINLIKSKIIQKPTVKKYNKSDLIHNSKFSFYKYNNIKKFRILSFELQYSYLFEFKYDLYNFNTLEPQKEKTKKKINVYNTASELRKELPGIYFDVYYDLSDAKRNKMDSKYDHFNLKLDTYDYEKWYKQ